ncbi:MAG: phosphotransferase [Desulfobacteraceae bacterium]|jgi:aminoglycoside/choline kinase family phosphotransferase
MKNPSEKEIFIAAFLREQGLPENSYAISILAGDGSARLFQRIEPNDTKLTYVFMENPPINDFIEKENLAYLKIGNHMLARGIPLPGILKYDLDTGCFILEDMGDRLLQEEALKSENRIKLYEDIIETLIRLQIDGREGFDTAWCCQTPYYDSSLMREKEAWYFRDSFLRDYINTDVDLSMLDEPFEHIITMAEKAEKNYLLHRDFQSRNIMCRSEGISILDWQGARLGPLAYDLASLIFDPYVDLSENERRHFIEVYASLLKSINNDAVESFKRYFHYIALMRNLQVLGAYSFLSIKQGKKYFEKYIPTALKSLKTLLDEIADPGISPLIDIIRGLKT